MLLQVLGMRSERHYLLQALATWCMCVCVSLSLSRTGKQCKNCHNSSSCCRANNCATLLHEYPHLLCSMKMICCWGCVHIVHCAVANNTRGRDLDAEVLSQDCAIPDSRVPSKRCENDCMRYTGMQHIPRKFSQPVESMHETNTGCIIQLCLQCCSICIWPLQGQHALGLAGSLPAMLAKTGDACFSTVRAQKGT